MKKSSRIIAGLASLTVLGLAACSCSQKSEMDKFIDNLMSKMSVEQKIGQLNLHSVSGFRSASKITTEDENMKALLAGQMGGIYGTSNVENMRAMQDIAMQSPNAIPLIFGLDVIHGHQTIFPIPLGISTSWNLDLVKESASIAADEASAQGVCWVFSPMVDIARDPRWGRIAEGSGEDQYLGGEIARAMVQGYQGSDMSADTTVMACVKHYALYGGAEAGRDYNTVDMSRQRIMNEYMNPYKAACEAGAGSYMSSFNEFEGIPATVNKYLLTDVLRDQWGFKGFVVSDATAVQEVIAHGIGDLQEVSARAIQAGLDMDMNSDGFVGTLMKSLEEGRISKADIDKACRRVLEAKYKLGLFDDPYKYLKGDRESEVYSDAHKAFARELADECQVLLKNDGVLPLSKDAKVAVIGPFANNASQMAGTWTMSDYSANCVTIYDGIKEALSEKGSATTAEGSWIMLDGQAESDLQYGMIGKFMPGFVAPPVHTTPKETLMSQALAAAAKADVIVACLGETSMMNGEGASRSDISIPDAQEELLRALKKTGKPVVLVLSTGRPLTLCWEDENIDAILCAWSLGSEAGHAIADVLFGDVNPSAKLTTSFPRNVGQIPLYYNHKNTGRPHGEYDSYVKFKSNYIDVINAPLYPFGYGLSYTNYEYGDVKLSAAEMPSTGSVTASVDVTNTGSVDGKEIVEMYIHDIYSTSTRPVKELRGFQKVEIKAGETKTVTFEISAETLKYYNHELEYVCEPGDFEIMVGPNSRDVKMATLTVK